MENVSSHASQLVTDQHPHHIHITTYDTTRGDESLGLHRIHGIHVGHYQRY